MSTYFAKSICTRLSLLSVALLPLVAIALAAVPVLAVTHDDGESFIPEFLVRFKAESGTATLTMECITYDRYDASTAKWKPYRKSVTGSTVAPGTWKQLSITMLEGIPLDMTSKLKITGDNVTEYQVMINTPDAKFQPHVDNVPQRMIIRSPGGGSLSHNFHVMFLHQGRTGLTAGKVERASAGNDNLRISLGHGLSGRPLGHLSIRKRWAPWIADPSFESFKLKKEDGHHQIVCPQMIFEVIKLPGTAFTIKGFDRDTQPANFIPYIPPQGQQPDPEGTGYYDYSGKGPILTYTMTYIEDEPNKTETYTFDRTEGITEMTSKATRQVVVHQAQGIWYAGYCVTPICFPDPWGGYQWCSPPSCVPPMWVETEPGSLENIDRVWDWKLRGSAVTTRFLQQKDLLEISTTSGILGLKRTRFVELEGETAFTTHYKEESSNEVDMSNGDEDAIFWPTLNINFDGAAGAFDGTAKYYYTPGSGGHLKLKSRVLPGGNWEKYTYYDNFRSFGMVKTATVPFKNSPATPADPDTGAMVTEYTYAADWDGSLTLPASIVTTFKGSGGDQVVSRKEFDYTGSFLGQVGAFPAEVNAYLRALGVDQEQINNQAAKITDTATRAFVVTLSPGLAEPGMAKLWVSQSSEFVNPVDPALVSVSKRFRADDYPWLRDLPFAEEFPDGRKQVYVYQSGVIDSSTYNFQVTGFADTESRNAGRAFRSVKIKGFKSANSSLTPYDEGNCRWFLDPIDLYLDLTTAEVRVIDPFGRLFAEETWALSPSGAFVITSRVVHKYDPAGNLVKKLRLILDGGQAAYSPIYEAQYTTRNGTSLDYLSISFDNTVDGNAQPTGRKQYERGEDGVITKYYYDVYGRVSQTVNLSPPALADLPHVPAVQTVYKYDSENRVTATTVGPVQSTEGASHPDAMRSEKHYNLAGILTQTVEPGGRTTDFIYDNAARTVTTIARGLNDAAFDRQTIKENFLDGRLRTVSGHTVPILKGYTVVNGEMSEREWVGDSTAVTDRFSYEDKDWLGRTVRVQGSNPGGIQTLNTYAYDPLTGQRLRAEPVGRAHELYKYAFSQLTMSGLDMDNTADLEEASLDRIAHQGTGVWIEDDAFWERTDNESNHKNNNGERLLTSKTLKRTSHFPRENVTILGGTVVSMILDSETRQKDAAGTTVKTLKYIAPTRGLTLTRTINSRWSNPEDQIFLNGKLVTTVDSGGVRQDREYDQWGRLTNIIDRTGSTRIYYRSSGLVNGKPTGTAETWLVQTPDRIWTEYGYDPAGRLNFIKRYSSKSDTKPDSGASGRITRMSYNRRNQLRRVWGDVPYPLENLYYEAADGQLELIGHLKEQVSFNGGSGWSGATWPTDPGTGNRTTYTYYPETGLLNTETRHGAGGSMRTTTYTYDELGRLATRVTQRGSITQYTYKTGSGELESVTYSGTGAGPGITYGYDRMGAIEMVTDGSGTRTFIYRNLDRQLDYENLPAATYGVDCRMTLTYDALNRPQGHSFTTPARPGALSSSLDFNPASGWLQQITTPLSPSPFSYTYKVNSRLVETLANSALPSGAAGLNIVNVYETDKDRIDSITATAGRQVARHDQDYDEQSRLWKTHHSGELFQDFGVLTETFGYNDRNELTSVISTATPETTGISLPDRKLIYEYDNAGNREFVDRGYSETGVRRMTYTPNLLGQYDSRSGESYVPMAGVTRADMSVTLRNVSAGSPVNATMVGLQAPKAAVKYYYGEVSYDGSASWLPLEAKISSSSQPVHTYQRNILARSSSESFGYDLDGNLTSDSLWSYTYDGESRLVQVETLSTLSPAVPRTRLVFTYDYLGRRVKKEVYNGNSSGTIWTLQDTRCFVYDGWNLILEMRQTGGSAPVPVTYFAWGLDASGTLQGAGGVGGLLGCITGLDGANSKPYLAINDGLGNVAGLLDGQNGALVAEYEYSPFGELARAIGPMAVQNPIRFSSKYYDPETGLVNFGFRYYSPNLGRFINRDPQGDPGWANLLSSLSGGNSPSWSYIGNLLRNVHENRSGGKESTLAHSTESGSNTKNSTLSGAPIFDRKAHVSSMGGDSGSGSDDRMPVAASWSHAYAYLANNPLNDVEYLGLWGSYNSSFRGGGWNPFNWLASGLDWAGNQWDNFYRGGGYNDWMNNWGTFMEGVGRMGYETLPFLKSGTGWLLGEDFDGMRLTSSQRRLSGYMFGLEAGTTLASPWATRASSWLSSYRLAGIGRGSSGSATLFAPYTGGARAIPLHDMSIPWYSPKYVTPSFRGEAWVSVSGRTPMQVAMTKAHEGRHLMDYANHPQLTHLLYRGNRSYFAGSGLTRYWFEFRGYHSAGKINGFRDLFVPFRSFEPIHRWNFGLDLGLFGVGGLGAAYSTWSYFNN